MKLLLTSLLVLFMSLSAHGQGQSVRANGGFGTNETWIGTSTFSGSLGSVVQINNGQIWGRALLGAPVFTGDGSGLTNLSTLTTNSIFINNVTNNNLTVTNNAFINNITVTNTAIFKGNASFTSNAYFLNLNFTTNLATTAAIAVGQTAQAVQTNNNIVFTGYSGVDGTNAQPFTLLVTNTAGSAAVKFIQFPTGTIMLSSPFTNVVYLTNQGVFSGWIYPGFGSNGTWVGN